MGQVKFFPYSRQTKDRALIMRNRKAHDALMMRLTEHKFLTRHHLDKKNKLKKLHEKIRNEFILLS
jgi:hypothetical protein